MAPLDWGLGHASRCIPLIRYLKTLQWEIVLAGEGPSAILLQQEFPDLRFIPLRGYQVTYPKNGKRLIFHLITQIPKIIRTIRYEKNWLRNLQEKENFDLVISDNRYGLHASKTYSIIITHQLNIVSGMGKSIDALVQKILYPIIHQFNQCWVPDSAGDNNIAGLLSHPRILPKNVKYIGPLSRLEKINEKEQLHHAEKKDNSILVLLSGLEPQRTQLEEKLLEQLSGINLPVTFVRGIPQPTTHNPQLTQNPQPKTQNSKLNFITSQELEQTLPNFSLVICRSGYSTVMDLLKFQKKAILIPTPGQTEQEYLAKRLSEMGVFVSQDQENLNLSQAIADCQNSNPASLSLNFENYKKAFQELGIS